MYLPILIEMKKMWNLLLLDNLTKNNKANFIRIHDFTNASPTIDHYCLLINTLYQALLVPELTNRFNQLMFDTVEKGLDVGEQLVELQTQASTKLKEGQCDQQLYLKGNILRADTSDLYKNIDILDHFFKTNSSKESYTFFSYCTAKFFIETVTLEKTLKLTDNETMESYDVK
jgi:hypothetical protein